MKRLLCPLLILAMLLSLAACGKKEAGTETPAVSGDLPTIDSINLGEDYQDITAELKVLTNRTDIVDTTYAGYAEQFHELYPNITVTYEGITDYEEALNLRLPNGDWGDICFIPTSVSKADMGNYFIPFGSQETLEGIYNFIGDKAYNGQVYGIANGGNADGIIYNQAVWKEAGIVNEDGSVKIPQTPDEFLEDLQIIKDKTGAVPLYTNFSAGWPMGAWDAYIFVAATGDPEFHNELPHMSNPFAKRDDGTGPYEVYRVLYEAVARDLVEEDPMSSDWDGSKGMMNRGEIASMVLGSWAVAQCQAEGDHPEDVCYMPFPIYVTDEAGNRVTSAGGNYSYAINAKTGLNQQIASMLYVKWLLEESPIFEDEGCIPALKSAPLPAFLESFTGIELVSNSPAPAGEEDLFDEVNLASEVGINNDDYPDCNILEAALTGSKTLDEIMDEWNAKWSSAQESLGVEVR